MASKKLPRTECKGGCGQTKSIRHARRTWVVVHPDFYCVECAVRLGHASRHNKPLPKEEKPAKPRGNESDSSAQ